MDEPEFLDEWIRRYNGGDSLQTIANNHQRETGQSVTSSKIRYWLKSRGVKMRPAQQYRRSYYDF